MAKKKVQATGEGYLGEILVHKVTRAIGVVENVTEAGAGWAPEVTLKLADGTLKKGRIGDFREASGAERAKLAPPEGGAKAE